MPGRRPCPPSTTTWRPRPKLISKCLKRPTQSSSKSAMCSLSISHSHSLKLKKISKTFSRKWQISNLVQTASSPVKRPREPTKSCLISGMWSWMEPRRRGSRTPNFLRFGPSILAVNLALSPCHKSMTLSMISWLSARATRSCSRTMIAKKSYKLTKIMTIQVGLICPKCRSMASIK